MTKKGLTEVIPDNKLTVRQLAKRLSISERAIRKKFRAMSSSEKNAINLKKYGRKYAIEDAFFAIQFVRGFKAWKSCSKL